jgi:hypothetical protein
VNDDVTRNDQWQPSLAISPDGTRLCIAWYDRRLDSANKLIDRFATICSVNALGTATPGANFRVTTQSFPAVFGADPMVNGTYMGDYDQMTASTTHFAMTWGDNRDDSTAHSGKNANVRFARFGIATTGSPSVTAGGPLEPHKEIPVDQVPSFADQAIKQAVDQAPTDVLAKPVVWEKAFALEDTIAMYMLRGKDAKGQSIEVESKGTRVVELEVMVPPGAIPAPVTQGARAMSPAFVTTRATVIIVGGRVVSYVLVGSESGGANAPTTGGTAGRAIEANFSGDGKLISRRSVGN